MSKNDEQLGNVSDQAFQELKAKLERGAAQAEAGELLDGDEVFDELREMIEERRRTKGPSGGPAITIMRGISRRSPLWNPLACPAEVLY
jgi:hypothetical protein